MLANLLTYVLINLFIGSSLNMKKIITYIIFFFLTLNFQTSAEEPITMNMVFVPASEKGDDKDYINLIKIINDLTGYIINPIKVTDYNAAVESMRAGKAQIAWFGGKTYIVAAEIASAEAFAAGIRKGDSDASYFAYFVVRSDSPYKTLSDLKGKTLGGVRGYHYLMAGEILDSAEVAERYDIYLADSRITNVRMLLGGRIDAAVLNDELLSALRNASVNYLDQLFVSEQIEHEYEMSVLIAPNKNISRDEMQRLLRDLARDGRLDTLFARFNLQRFQIYRR